MLVWPLTHLPVTGQNLKQNSLLKSIDNYRNTLRLGCSLNVSLNLPMWPWKTPDLGKNLKEWDHDALWTVWSTGKCEQKPEKGRVWCGDLLAFPQDNSVMYPLHRWGNQSPTHLNIQQVENLESSSCPNGCACLNHFFQQVDKIMSLEI